MDPSPFEQAHPKLVEDHKGAHLPQTATVWESLMWAIVGQQVNLPFAYRLRRVLVELCGEPASNGLRRHPSAEQVATLDYADLTSRQFSNSKAHYVIDTARLIASGALPLETFPSREPSEVEEMLLNVRGVGIWTANYVMMRGCAFPDCVPAGDSALSASLQTFLELDHRPDAHETRTLMERFAPWRSLATFHLWLRK
jgi:3-methyladenine DNA glycosylase/8-oxoguanine DNA glycosylase